MSHLPERVRLFSLSVLAGLLAGPVLLSAGSAGTVVEAQPLAVAVMDRQGAPGVKFDVEGSGYGFRVIRQLTPQQAEQPHSCNMARP